MKPLLSLAFALTLAAAAPALAAPPSSGPAEAAAAQLKRAVSVEDFQGAEAMGAAATSLTAILEDDLVKDGRFIVIAKPSASVQATQAAAAATAAATPQTADADKAATAALTPNLIVRGTITKFEQAAKGSSLTLGGLPMRGVGGGAAGVNGQRSIVELTLQLVDGTTGQVLASAHGTGSAGQRQMTAGATSASGATVGGSTQKATPVQQAADEAIRKAINELAIAAERIPWQAMVVDAEDGSVYINAGSDENVSQGLTLGLYRKKKVLTDPVSGAVIDVLMDRVGTVQVVDVRPRTSTAKKVDGDDAKTGDLVRTQ